MFGNASQGGEQADQLYLGMLGSLLAFLWSVAEYLRPSGYIYSVIKRLQENELCNISKL